MNCVITLKHLKISRSTFEIVSRIHSSHVADLCDLCIKYGGPTLRPPISNATLYTWSIMFLGNRHLSDRNTFFFNLLRYATHCINAFSADKLSQGFKNNNDEKKNEKERNNNKDLLYLQVVFVRQRYYRSCTKHCLSSDVTDNNT